MARRARIDQGGLSRIERAATDPRWSPPTDRFRMAKCRLRLSANVPVRSSLIPAGIVLAGLQRPDKGILERSLASVSVGCPRWGATPTR